MPLRPSRLRSFASRAALVGAVLTTASVAGTSGALGAAPAPHRSPAARVGPALNGWSVSSIIDPDGRGNHARFGVTGAQSGVIVYRSGSAVHVRRTTDGGATWTTRTLLSPAGTRIGSIATAVNGRFVDVLQRAGATTWLRRSGTGGRTWTAARSIPFVAARPAIARGDDGLLAVIGFDDAASRWRVRVSQDDGATWGPLRTVGRWERAGGDVAPSAVAISGTTISVFFASEADQLVTRSSTDGGASWSRATVIVPSIPVNDLSVAVNGATVLIAYDQDARYTQRLVVRRSTDRGVTWSSAKQLGRFVTGAALGGGPGDWHLVSSDESGVWSDRTSPDGLTWSAPTVISTGHEAVAPPIGVGVFTAGPAAAFLDGLEGDDAIWFARG